MKETVYKITYQVSSLMYKAVYVKEKGNIKSVTVDMFLSCALSCKFSTMSLCPL